MKELVDNSPLLQYKTELVTLGMQDVRSTGDGLLTRLSRLRTAELAWSQFRPTSQDEVPTQPGLEGHRVATKTFGNILAQFFRGGHTVVLHDLTPEGTPKEPRRWNIIVNFPIDRVFVRAEDDLLVLAEHL